MTEAAAADHDLGHIPGPPIGMKPTYRDTLVRGRLGEI